MISSKRHIPRQLKWIMGLLLGLGMSAYFGAFNTSFFDRPSDTVFGLAKVSPVTSDQLPFHLPDNGDPLSGEEDQRESPDEKEWDDADGLQTNQALFTKESKLNWLFFKQLERGFYNRSQVSLFVLYHCWKGFLS